MPMPVSIKIVDPDQSSRGREGKYKPSFEEWNRIANALVSKEMVKLVQDAFMALPDSVSTLFKPTLRSM